MKFLFLLITFIALNLHAYTIEFDASVDSRVTGYNLFVSLDNVAWKKIDLGINLKWDATPEYKIKNQRYYFKVNGYGLVGDVLKESSYTDTITFEYTQTTLIELLMPPGALKIVF